MDEPAEDAPLGALRARLPQLLLRDEQRLLRRLDRAPRAPRLRAREAALSKIAAEVEAAEQRVARRLASVPQIRFPEDLPVSQHRDEIAAAIRAHQVVVLAGETGSGKTTQLPKICLELGRGVRGTIGHTQPRRLAARSVADRIAEELSVPLGVQVGFKVRFTDAAREDTLVKLMTDGILLAEIQGDRELWDYDTLIIDEAHERSLNIDFILGYLRQLLPRRPDLKVVVTSATIDPERFSRHFGGAPVLEVSGRTYPVEVRYRPLVEDVTSADPDDEGDSGDRGSPRDQTQAICEAVAELCAEGPGDILVFLSGEREIRDTADAVARMSLRDTEILPLYARLSAAEQHRVFSAHAGRRVVLATNVAETSLTVPGIRYVVDPGTARISRYSHRLKVQRLPIEAISQASANQRTGRCGRVAAGVCIRLYSEEDFLGRPEFTDPEILRTNLASVILAMAALGLGDVEAFPFVEPPDRRNIRDGRQLLAELGALDPRHVLTPLGRTLAQLPVDPRLARMVLAADRNGCLREVIVLAAALSIQDPRERPIDQQQAADDRHRRFADPTSDFLGYLNLWTHLQEQQRTLSSSAFRRLCKAEFLHYLRIREWQDLETQLRQVARSIGLRTEGTPADPERIHRSLLAGLLSHIGLWDGAKREYAGARGASFAAWPGSALFRKPPAWVMAGELVETSRLWGRDLARIEPEWVEPLAADLVKRTYSEPHWSAKHGAAMAYEKVTLYGVPIVASRRVAYGGIEPQLSRELFIRQALVSGEWRTHHRFFAANRELLEEVGELEQRVRRRDVLVDEETLFDFYDQRVPAHVVSAAHFDAWWKSMRHEQPDLLDFSRSLLVRDDASDVDAGPYPDGWRQGELELRLSYQFEPGAETDGVTVHVPLAVLNQVQAGDLDWQVPGLRLELVTALIRSLPKALRRNFVPAPDVARAALAGMPPRTEPLLDALERALLQLTGVRVPREAWDLDRLPGHLRTTYRVEDDQGRTLGQGKDLAALRSELQAQVRATLATAGRHIERRGLRRWDFGVLPHTFEDVRSDVPVRGYPALVDEGDSVAVRVLPSEAEQQRAMAAGTRRLLLLGAPSPVRRVVARLANAEKLVLNANPHGSVAALLDDCLACALDEIVADCGGPAWDADAFARLLDAASARLETTFAGVLADVTRVLAAAADFERRLRGTTSLTLLPSLTDIRAQVSGLVHPGFVAETGARRLPDLTRYLRAAEHRLTKLPDAPARDRTLLAKVEAVEAAHRQLLDSLPPARREADDVRQLRWMLQELRVSLFAQGLGTPYPVSEKRILRAIEAVTP